MGKRNSDKGRLAPFVPIFRHTMKTPAWQALSVGGRATFLELKANYNTKAQNAVFLSARDGAKALGACKDTICKWVHELEHYGFIVEIEADYPETGIFSKKKQGGRLSTNGQSPRGIRDSDNFSKSKQQRKTGRRLFGNRARPLLRVCEP
jgi:hypothetical protein